MDNEVTRIRGARSLPRLRVLAAEDQRVNRRLMELIFSDLGCQLKVVKDGYEALDAIKDANFDFIFLDLQMPGLDGIDTAKAIELELGARTPPIFMVSADLSPETQSRCRERQIVALLPKPLNDSTVEMILRGTWDCDIRPELQDESTEPWALPDGLQNFTQAGKHDILRKILEIYVHDCSQRLQSLLKALRHREWQTSTQLSHSLAGSSAQIGASRLATLLKDLEAFTATNQRLSVRRLFLIYREYDRVESSIVRYLDASTRATGPLLCAK